MKSLAKKLLKIEEAFSCCGEVHYDDYVETLFGDLEEWESCEAHCFKEHFHREMETVAKIQQWIENSREITAPHTEAAQENEDSVSTTSCTPCTSRIN